MEHQDRHNPESAPKFTADSISTVFSKSSNPLDLPQKSVRFLRPNPSEIYVHCSSRTKLLLCNVRTASLVSLTVLISILLLWYNILISPLTLWWNLSFVVVAAAVVVVIAEQLSCHLPLIYENITILPQYIFTASLSLYFRYSTYGWRSRTKIKW